MTKNCDGIKEAVSYDLRELSIASNMRVQFIEINFMHEKQLNKWYGETAYMHSEAMNKTIRQCL